MGLRQTVYPSFKTLFSYFNVDKFCIILLLRLVFMFDVSTTDLFRVSLVGGVIVSIATSLVSVIILSTCYLVVCCFLMSHNMLVVME